MQRELKFRAWRTSNVNNPKGRMHYDVGLLNGVVLSPKGTTLTRAILMQFTGLKDKNGKEIYEGDILQVMSRAVSPVPSVNDHKLYRSVIKYDGGEFIAIDQMTGGSWHWGGWGKHEVVGNLYENQELLE